MVSGDGLRFSALPSLDHLKIPHASNT